MPRVRKVPVWRHPRAIPLQRPECGDTVDLFPLSTATHTNLLFPQIKSRPPNEEKSEEEKRQKQYHLT